MTLLKGVAGINKGMACRGWRWAGRKTFASPAASKDPWLMGLLTTEPLTPPQRGQYSSPSSKLIPDSLLSIRRECGMRSSAQGPQYMQLPGLCPRKKVTHLSSGRQSLRVCAHSPKRLQVFWLSMDGPETTGVGSPRD